MEREAEGEGGAEATGGACRGASAEAVSAVQATKPGGRATATVGQREVAPGER